MKQEDHVQTIILDPAEILRAFLLEPDSDIDPSRLYYCTVWDMTVTIWDESQKAGIDPLHVVKLLSGREDRTSFFSMPKVIFSAIEPFTAMILFMQARENNLKIPEFLLDWVARVFSKWFQAEGKTSFEVILGLDSTHAGYAAFKKELLNLRNTYIYKHIALLRALGYTVDEAIDKVIQQARNPAHVWNHSKWQIAETDPLQKDSLLTFRNYYYKWPIREQVELSIKHLLEHCLSEESWKRFKYKKKRRARR